MQVLCDSGGNPAEIAKRVAFLTGSHIRDLRHAEDRTKRKDCLRFCTLPDEIRRTAERIASANQHDLLWSYWVQGHTLPLDNSTRAVFLKQEGYADLSDRLMVFASRLEYSIRPLQKDARNLKGRGGKPRTVRALRNRQKEFASYIEEVTRKPHLREVTLLMNAAAELWELPRITLGNLKKLLNPSKKNRV
jgi:hypothetical protein